MQSKVFFIIISTLAVNTCKNKTIENIELYNTLSPWKPAKNLLSPNNTRECTWSQHNKVTIRQTSSLISHGLSC